MEPKWFSSFPKLYGDEDQRDIRLLSASDIKLPRRENTHAEFWDKIQYFEISSNIIPYLSPENLQKRQKKAQSRRNVYTSRVFDESYEFSGKYSNNLLEEVARYALMASIIAKNQDCDVIHAHDWLTYSAGVAAKEAMGKAIGRTYARNGNLTDRADNINQAVYELERHGMEKADKVITVSNFTKNIVLTKYGIDPAKVVTVHNAADSFMFSGCFALQTKTLPIKWFTFLGRITFQKGPGIFRGSSLQNTEKSLPNVRFVMAGLRRYVV